MSRFRKFWWFFLALLLGMQTAAPAFSGQAAIQPQAGAPAGPEAPAGPTDAHTPFRESVSQFLTAGQVFYWSVEPKNCTNGPAPTVIQRTRTTEWEDRIVFSRLPAVDQPCPYRIYSNIVADSRYLYWLDLTGIVRFPIDANPYSLPETILSVFQGGNGSGELVMAGDYLIGQVFGHLWYMETAQPENNAELGFVGEDAYNLEWDGTYGYIIFPDDSLKRFDLDRNFTTIDTNVSAYAPAGREVVCTIQPQNCVSHYLVYYVRSSQKNVLIRYDIDGSRTPVYTSSPQSGYVPEIFSIETVYNPATTFILTKDVILFEKRVTPPCGAFTCSAVDWMVRLPYGDGTPSFLYFVESNTYWYPTLLQTGDGYLWWKETPVSLYPSPDDLGRVLRLPAEAAGLPVINMRITGMQITQSIQNEYNDIFLVENKPTFLRLSVKSDGADVPNVTARLTAYWDGAEQETIQPTRPLITVKGSPNGSLNDQFVFALPLEWTRHPGLYVRAWLNPFGRPLEPDYSDNRPAAYGPYYFRTNPVVRFAIARPRFTFKGVNYQADDFQEIISWLYRAYPIGLGAGQAAAFDYPYTDNALGPRVLDYNNKDVTVCQDLLKVDKDGKVLSDDRNLCASYYLRGKLAVLWMQGVLPRNAYIYASVEKMARGSASPSYPVANGPSYKSNGWPFEVSGFYAGHEIGHLLGRSHPSASADNPATPQVEGCGHSASDPSFPFSSAWIGDPTHVNTAFDSQWGVPGGKYKIYRWFDNISDVMSYCTTPYQWLSDYTYSGMYDWLTEKSNPHWLNANVQAGERLTAQAGDYLSVSGLVASDGSDATFNYLSRVDTMMETPAPTPGSFSLKLLDSGGAELADYPFTPVDQDESSAWLSFVEVVPFTAGARQVQVVNRSSGSVLASQTVSANPPQVSNLSLGGASEPIQGNMPLSWNASDADGDALAFDILYSADQGLTFELLQASVTGRSTVIDTASLPGGSLLLRVRASDGVNTAYADSPAAQFTMKAPQPIILAPGGDSVQIAYGQPLNLSGYALDAQDGSLTGESELVWTADDGYNGETIIGVGPHIAPQLQAGENHIRLTATNSAGLSASAELTVTVGDDLNNPPPSLGVSPGLINWQATDGDTTQQSAELQIFNAGGPGALSWTASSSADWLQLGALSGSAPAQLSLSAAIDGLPENTTLNAEVTLTGAYQDQTETVTVPVLLQIGKGEIWDPPPPDVLPALQLFTPLILR